MTSYIVAIVLSMLVAGIYGLENSGQMTVRFVIFERDFSQALWPIICFSAGVILMWIASLIASLEIRAKYRRLLKERDARIVTLEEERNSLLTAVRAGAPKGSGMDESLFHDTPESTPAAVSSKTEGEAV